MLLINAEAGKKGFHSVQQERVFRLMLCCVRDVSV